MGNELVPPGGLDGPHHWLVYTVEHPDSVTAEASLDRLNLAENAGVLASAVDAAETTQARDSLEKMLAHQMAAAHAASMRLFSRAEAELSRGEWQGEHIRHECQLSGTRLINAAARLMSSYQDGLKALHQIRKGGQQIVTVQHVQVTDGGQAVVAGTVKGSDRGSKDGGADEI